MAFKELTDREKEVIRLIAEGYSSDEITTKLFISKPTVNSHRDNMLKKLGARNGFHLIHLAHKLKILP